MPPRIGSRVAMLTLLCALGCGSDDKVLEGENEPKDDAGGASSGDGGANGGTGDDAGGSGSSASAGNNDDGGADDDFVGGTPSDPTCDMNGIWIGNQVTRSEAIFAGQFSNNWYYLELTQNGDEVVVSKHYDCGVKVLGTVTVVVTPKTADALRAHNFQMGRKGSFKKGADGKCQMKFERFWSIRGADEARFAPVPRNSSESIDEVAVRLPLPTKSKTDGAEDWENDGKLGSAWQVTGIASGVRNSVQRDWTEWFTDASHSITAAADFKTDLIVRAKFDNEEFVLDASESTLEATSIADGGAEHILLLRFLGRSNSDPRVKALIKSTKAETCSAIQAALPARNKL